MTQPTESTTERGQRTQLSDLNDMQRYLVHEFVEDYQDGIMSRRDLISRVGHIAGGTAAGLALLGALGVSAAEVQAQDDAATPQPIAPQSPLSVPEGDPSVRTARITFPNGDATIMAYEARPGNDATPAATAATPAAAFPPLVLVCHENRGLTPHIEDVARRLATQGYLACAVDLMSREGGTSSIADQSSIPGSLSETDPSRHVSDFAAAIAYYGSQPDAGTAKIGMVGFCFGGGITWRAATLIPELSAAVPFYGPPPPLDAVPNIKAAVLGIYSADPNDFANDGRDDLAAALTAAGITFEITVYPGTQHAFNNDTGARYNEEQALAAWADTLAWFTTYLRK